MGSLSLIFFVLGWLICACILVLYIIHLMDKNDDNFNQNKFA